MNIVSYEIDKINEAEYNPRELSKKQHEDLARFEECLL